MNHETHDFPVLAALLLMPLAFAQDLTDVNGIVQRTNHASYYQGQDGKARVKMTITDDQGRTREREFTILRLNVGEGDGEQKFYVLFPCAGRCAGHGVYGA